MATKRKAQEIQVEETPLLDPDSLFRLSVDARFMRRCVNGKQPQTSEEFKKDNPKGIESDWNSAPHFVTLVEFCDQWHLHPVHSRSIPDSSSALFGLWLPCCLLLVDRHHLSGKLKNSRLAPQAWVSDIWKDAWEIGCKDKKMKVLDFCTTLGSEDSLGRLGYEDMKKMLEEFVKILDGQYVKNECFRTNLLMNFLSVDVINASTDRVLYPLIENRDPVG